MRHGNGTARRGLVLAAAVVLPAGFILSSAFDLGRLGTAGAGTNGDPAAVVLVDQDYGRTSLARLRGRFVVLNFMFTACGNTCPLETQQLAAVQRALPAASRDRVAFLSVTVDPAIDRPDVLKRFATQYGIDFATWSFVTGRPDEIDRFVAAFDALPAGGVRSTNHTTDVRLIGPDGSTIQRYRGAPLDVKRLTREIAQSMALDRIEWVTATSDK